MADVDIHEFSYGKKSYYYSKRSHCIYDRRKYAELSVASRSNSRIAAVNVNSIWLNLTNNCNLSCSYCFSPPANKVSSGKVSHTMTKDIAQRAVVFLGRQWKSHKNTAPARIVFFGGEPFLNFPVLEHCVYFANEWSRLSGVPFTFLVSTNGTLIDASISHFLRRENIGVQVSLDGPPQVQDRHRAFASGKGSYGIIMNNIRHLFNEPELNWHVRSTIAKDTPPISSIIRHFSINGFKQVHLKMINDNNKSNTGLTDLDFALLRNDMDSVVAEVLSARKRGVFVQPYEDNLIMLRDRRSRNFICTAGCSIVSIDADGSMYPCHRFHEWRGFRISHINDTFDETSCRQFSELQSYNIPRCNECWAVRLCGGCCPAESQAFNLPLGHPHEYWCKMKLIEAEISLKLAVASGLVDKRS
jgi:uncharacterized protein